MAEAVPEETLELVVDESLAEELERRGLHDVHTGDRVRLQIIHGEAAPARRNLPGWIGSFRTGDPTLARRAKEIVRNELGRADK